MVLRQRWGFGARHIQILLLALGALKDTWVMEVCSVTSSRVYGIGGYRAMHEALIPENKSFEWYIYAALCLSKLIGSFLTLFVNNKYIMVVTGFIQSICLLCIPSLKWLDNKELLCGIVLLIESMAVCQVPASHSLMGAWIPQFELGRGYSFLIGGSVLGFVMFHSLQVTFQLNFAAVYYFGGACSLMWCCTWLVFSAPDASKCFFITKEELVYISSKVPLIRKTAFNIEIPVYDLVTCLPLYGFILVNMALELFTVTGRPQKMMFSYFKNSVHLETSAAQYSMVQVLFITFCLVAGVTIATDKILLANYNLNNSRKIFSSISLWGFGVCSAFMGYCEKPNVVRWFFFFGYALKTSSIVGHFLVPFDVAPNYAGFIIGISGFLTTLFYPLIYDWEKDILRHSILKNEWNHYYYFTSCAVFMTQLIFLMCGNIYRRDFNLVGTYDWRHESIHSYP